MMIATDPIAVSRASSAGEMRMLFGAATVELVMQPSSYVLPRPEACPQRGHVPAEQGGAGLPHRRDACDNRIYGGALIRRTPKECIAPVTRHARPLENEGLNAALLTSMRLNESSADMRKSCRRRNTFSSVRRYGA
jgi:hypothetical protein